jgi:transcriptional regulator with XRE-family HTH domain
MLIADPASLAVRIREIRARKGLSQDELAARAQCNRKTIIALEKGENSQTHTLLRVLLALGMALDIVDNQVDLNYLDSLVEPYDGSN